MAPSKPAPPQTRPPAGLGARSSGEQSLGVEEGGHVVSALGGLLGFLAACGDEASPLASRQMTCFDSVHPPELSVREYLLRLFEQLRCSPECYLIAAIYVDRFLEMNQGSLQSSNVHRLVLAGTVLGAKFFDDVRAPDATFARVGGISARELSTLELQLAQGLGWHLYVSREECLKCLGVVRFWRKKGRSAVQLPQHVAQSGFLQALDAEVATHRLNEAGSILLLEAERLPATQPAQLIAQPGTPSATPAPTESAPVGEGEAMLSRIARCAVGRWKVPARLAGFLKPSKGVEHGGFDGNDISL